MAYVAEDGSVQIDKGYFDPAQFCDAYDKRITEGANKHPMLLHFRIATMGVVSKDNCHPFPVGRGKNDGAMIHNGSFFSDWQYEYTKSDTRMLAERMRNNFNMRDLTVAKKNLETEIGSYNKMVFLFRGGQFIIVNEKEGTWEDDVWYSNKWFIPSKKITPTARGQACGYNPARE